MKALKIFLAAVVLLAGLLTLNACQTLGSPLENYTWVLITRVDLGNIITPFEGTEINIFFDSKTKQFSGSGGCNQYSGSYKVEGLTLTIDPGIIMTKIACTGPRGEQEQKYLAALKAAERFKMEHGDLIVYCGQQILTFKRENPT